MKIHPITFEVENIDGKIAFSPEALEINMSTSMIRIKSYKPVGTILKAWSYCHIPMKCEDYTIYSEHTTVIDFELYNHLGAPNCHIQDFSDFNFANLQIGAKISVVLFPESNNQINPDALKNYSPPLIKPYGNIS